MEYLVKVVCIDYVVMIFFKFFLTIFTNSTVHSYKGLVEICALKNADNQIKQDCG